MKNNNNYFKLILIILLMLLKFSYAEDIEKISKNSNAIVYFNNFTIGIGAGLGVHTMSEDMRDNIRPEIDKLNQNRKEGESARVTPSGYMTFSADVYFDYFPAKWIDFSIFGEILNGDPDVGLLDEGSPPDQQLSSKYNMNKYTIGLIPGLAFRFTDFVILANAGITYNYIEFMDYSVMNFGYRIKLAVKLNDDFPNRDNGIDYIIPRIKLFILFDRCYGRDHGVEIGSTGIQFGVEYNIYQEQSN